MEPCSLHLARGTSAGSERVRGISLAPVGFPPALGGGLREARSLPHRAAARGTPAASAPAIPPEGGAGAAIGHADLSTSLPARGGSRDG